MRRPARRTQKAAEKRIRQSGSIAVVGAGSWGTALAIQFSRTGHPTILWGRDPAQLQSMAEQRANERYLPGVDFPENLDVVESLADALAEVDDVLVAVPSHSFRTTLELIAATDAKPRGICWATKGFENESGLLPHQVVAEVLPADLPVAVLSGPTFAAEVARALPSAMTIASNSEDYARRLAESITSNTFRAYLSDDMIGVEVGGATKNVYAIGAGLSDGLGFGSNTRIALLTRGLAEMVRLGGTLGAEPVTFMGLAGMGDLVLTCTDDQSRNRRFGLALARGETADAARDGIGQVVEGYFAADAVHHVAERHGVDMPIADQIYHVLYRELDPKDAVAALMSRPIMREQ